MLSAAVDLVLVLLVAVLVVRAFVYNAALGVALAIAGAFFARRMVRDAIRSVRWSRVAAGWDDGRRPIPMPRKGARPDLPLANPLDVGAAPPVGDDRQPAPAVTQHEPEQPQRTAQAEQPQRAAPEHPVAPPGPAVPRPAHAARSAPAHGDEARDSRAAARQLPLPLGGGTGDGGEDA